MATGSGEMPQVRLEDGLEQYVLCGTLLDQFSRAEALATGMAAKGRKRPGNAFEAAGRTACDLKKRGESNGTDASCSPPFLLCGAKAPHDPPSEPMDGG